MSRASEAAENAVRMPSVDEGVKEPSPEEPKAEPEPQKRANIPHDEITLLAIEGLERRKMDFARDTEMVADRLVKQIIKQNNLDPEGLGKDYRVEVNAIVFIENISQG